MGKSKRKVPGINASSTADISFILLIFFLVVTSMNSSMGLDVRLPKPPEEEVIPPKVYKRNNFTVFVNMNNEVMVTLGEKEAQIVEVSDLRGLAKEFITNKKEREDYPKMSDTTIVYYDANEDKSYWLPKTGEVVRVAKNHVISLHTDRSTQYQLYFEVQNELYGAYNELRDSLARAEYGIPYDELDANNQMVCRMVYPVMISEAEPRTYTSNK